MKYVVCMWVSLERAVKHQSHVNKSVNLLVNTCICYLRFVLKENFHSTMEWTACLWMHVSIKEVNLLTEYSRYAAEPFIFTS